MFSLVKYDSMSTEELQELLCKHAHAELAIDTEDLFQIMAVLSKRRQQQDPQAFRSDEKAFTDFRENHMCK